MTVNEREVLMTVESVAAGSRRNIRKLIFARVESFLESPYLTLLFISSTLPDGGKKKINLPPFPSTSFPSF